MIPHYPRRGRLRAVRDAVLLPLFLFVTTACLACSVAMWKRTQSPVVAESDAMRVLRTAKDPAEREQAIAAIARRTREMVSMLTEQAATGDANARMHLRNIAQQATEGSK